jgi:hypothetical protein
MNWARKQFREAVFDRDEYRCVICGETDDLAAHHIIERRLWGESQGYFGDNGVTLCQEHHIKAEQTVLSCDELREAVGIKSIMLPEHLYEEYVYTKWGDIILPDGRRLKGELFFDESVQKILKSGNMLDSYCKYVKYPRTMHLPWSGKTTDDDRMLTSTKHFTGKEVVVTIKLDGENSSLYKGYFHARSIDGNSHPSQSFVKNLHSQISYDIPEDWRICGENLYAKHSIKYDHLKSYFLVFSIWNERNECLSWDDTLLWAELLGLETVPVIYEGKWDESKIKSLATMTDHQGDPVEGYVVRLRDSFDYGSFKASIAKYVSKEFREGLKHEYNWRYKPFEVNKVEK